MNFLKQERETLEKFLPDLDSKLENIPLLEMESKGSPAIQIFRELGGPGLLIPGEYGGMGVTLLELIRMQRAIASRSPSLAVAANMHHCTLAAMLEDSLTDEDIAFFSSIAQHNLYLASGFADGRMHASVLFPDLQAERIVGGVKVNGSKKPCSLSKSMDFLTASILIPSASGEGNLLALAIIPAETPGIERRPFWNTWALGGAESDEVILKDVEVPEELIFPLGKPEALGSMLAKTFLWFEVMISASYLGAASALVERVLVAGKGSAAERMVLAVEVEGAMAALEGIAYQIERGDNDDRAVATALFVRYAVQRAIERVSVQASELMGGIAFVSSGEIAYLLATSRAIAFHPPSRLSMASGLDGYLAGEPLVMP